MRETGVALNRFGTPVAPLRGEGWAADAALAIRLRDALDARLAERGWASDTADLAGLTIASAVLRGGLWRPAAWVALARSVRTGASRPTVADRFPGLAFLDLDLVLPAASQASTNTEPGRELLRWFPDVVSLDLLRRWALVVDDTAEVPDEAVATRLIFEALGERIQRKFAAGRLARAAVAALEARSGILPPTLLVTAATGENLSHSVNGPAWKAFCAGPVPVDPAASPAKPERTPVSEPRPARGSGPEPDARTPDATLTAFLALLAQHASTSSRRGTRAFRDGIRALLEGADTAPPVVEALLHWYAGLLEAGDKPGTIADYHSIAGRHLVTTLGASDPWGMEPIELGARLGQALSLSGYSDRAHPAGRIAHFARVATRELGWPEAELDDLLPEDARARPSMVATDILPWSAHLPIYKALKGACDVPRRTALMEALCFALMARGGLRISEVVGRVVADLSEDLTVHVHCTLTHGIKSDAARRLVPVGLFLPGEMARDLGKFREKRVAAAREADKELLFAPDGFLPDNRLDPERLRRRLRQITRTLLGMPLGPHALRHSWASVVEPLLALKREGLGVVAVLTGWNAREVETVRARLLGPDLNSRKVATRLANLIGHRELSPVTARSYCHLAGLSLGQVILDAPERMPAERAARMLNLNGRSLGHVANDGTLRLEDLRAVVLARARPSVIARRDKAGGLPPTSGGEEDEARTHDAEILTPANTLEILVALRNGKSAREAALASGRPLSEVERIEQHARELMAGATRKGGTRLKASNNGPPILPASRFAKREAGILAQLLLRSTALSREARAAWAEPILRRGDADRNRLLFRHPDELEVWLRAFPQIILVEDLRVMLLAPLEHHAVCLEAWRRALGAGARIEAKDTGARGMSSPFGRAVVTVGPSETFLSVQALRRVAFIIAVTDAVGQSRSA